MADIERVSPDYCAVSRWRLMRDRIRDALIAMATAWAFGGLVLLVTGSRHAGSLALVVSWLPVFVICRMASAEYLRRTRNDSAARS